jgi:hypothetical protein
MEEPFSQNQWYAYACLPTKADSPSHPGFSVMLKGPLRKMNFEETTFDRNEAGSDLPSSLNHLAKKTSYCPAPSFWSSGLYLLLGPKRDGDW